MSTRNHLIRADIQAHSENLQRYGNWFPHSEDDEDTDAAVKAATGSPTTLAESLPEGTTVKVLGSDGTSTATVEG